MIVFVVSASGGLAIALIFYLLARRITGPAHSCHISGMPSVPPMPELTREYGVALLEAATKARSWRAESMPTEKEALHLMNQAYQRLTELGFSGASYCPKDGSMFDAIEAGSTGIHDCFYDGDWPDGHYWIPDKGDLWPSRPILFRLKEKAND